MSVLKIIPAKIEGYALTKMELMIVNALKDIMGQTARLRLSKIDTLAPSMYGFNPGSSMDKSQIHPEFIPGYSRIISQKKNSRSRK